MAAAMNRRHSSLSAAAGTAQSAQAITPASKRMDTGVRASAIVFVDWSGQSPAAADDSPM